MVSHLERENGRGSSRGPSMISVACRSSPRVGRYRWIFPRAGATSEWWPGSGRRGCFVLFRATRSRSSRCVPVLAGVK